MGAPRKGKRLLWNKEQGPKRKLDTFATHEFTAKGNRIAIKDPFRAYNDFAEAADDYGRFLSTNKRYARCFALTRDANRFADCLAESGYATDPRYAVLVKTLMRQNEPHKYDI